MDSEVIVNLIARSKAETQEERIADAARQIEGAFSRYYYERLLGRCA